MRFISLCCLLFAGSTFAQKPIALPLSDPKFAPRWETIPGPTLAPSFAGRSFSYAAGARTPGSYEVAYCLVDETFKVSPVSSVVAINPTCHDWDIVGTTPNVPLWTRAGGILWLFRPVGTIEWRALGVDENRGNNFYPNSGAMKPFKPIAGWLHRSGGHWLYPASFNFPALSDTSFYPPSTVLVAAPPAPVVRVLEVPNRSFVVGFSWACNQNETPMCPPITVQAIGVGMADRNAPFMLKRNMPAGAQQPPQGALGMYVYLQDNGQWHRQPCPDGHTGDLWALDVVTLRVDQFVASGIAPGNTNGRSYLSSLHLALRDWARDVIVDVDQTICCPLVSEFSGKTWSYQPRNHWLAVYGTTTAAGTWTLTIDGVTTAPMVRTNNFGNGWAQWQPMLDAAFGAGNVKIGSYWPWFAPKIELTGKWAATDMRGKVSVQVKDAGGVVVNSGIVAGDGYAGPQPDNWYGQSWVMSQADSKFNRTISTSNAGGFVVQDSPVTPDSEAVTGYPTGWPLWLECSQHTSLTGCHFMLMKSNCAVSTCDNSGGGCFHLQLLKVSSGLHPTNTLPVTFGLRCVDTSSYGWNNHICSELIAEKCSFNAKFPVVCEGVQAANWQLRDLNTYSDGTFDSAILTAANAGNITLGGRFTADNARCLVASVWCKSVFMESAFFDKAFPCWVCSNANSFTNLTIYGGKANQIINYREYIEPALLMMGYQESQLSTISDQGIEALGNVELNYLHAFESIAGPAQGYVMRLTTDRLDSQENGTIQAKMITPLANAVYKPRAVDEVPSLLRSLLP